MSKAYELLKNAIDALDKDVAGQKKIMLERCLDCEDTKQCNHETGCKRIGNDDDAQHQKILNEIKAKIAKPREEPKKVKVEIIESEKGWGQKIDEIMEFDSKEEAENFCRDYNNKYNPPRDTVPEWYMYARLEGQATFTMLR